MAFLRTFTAMLVAGVVWMALFVEFGDANTPTLNIVAGWLSPSSVFGWFFYAALCVACFLLAQRFMGGGSDPTRGDHGP